MTKQLHDFREGDLMLKINILHPTWRWMEYGFPFQFGGFFLAPTVTFQGGIKLVDICGLGLVICWLKYILAERLVHGKQWVSRRMDNDS